MGLLSPLEVLISALDRTCYVAHFQRWKLSSRVKVNSSSWFVSGDSSLRLEQTRPRGCADAGVN